MHAQSPDSIVGIKMVLANGIAGMTFAGADVGGFFGNPETEMLVRWYQVRGIFAPQFFRAHAHIDTKRREPYLLEHAYKDIVKDTLRLRYSMLPIWYTSLREASVMQVPPFYGKDKYNVDDQYYISKSGLLAGANDREGSHTGVHLSRRPSLLRLLAASAIAVSIRAELHQIPLLIRGGSVVPTRERPRRASPLMKHDPFTLRITLNKKGNAQGELYRPDDGESHNYQQGEFVWREFTAERTSQKQKSGQPFMKTSSHDLASARLSEAVQDISVSKYDQTSIKVEETSAELDWTYDAGVAADERGNAR